MRSGGFQLLDSSVLVPYFRAGRFRRTVEAALEHETLLLCSVVWMELYAGTRDHESKRQLDIIRCAAQKAGRLVSPVAEDFFRAGVALSFRSRSEGALRPGENLCDLLICLCAARSKAVLVAGNLRHLEIWRRVLSRSGLGFRLERPA
ncbi:MAG: PIN domain-containing protein [Myxococcales bacterium]|nr:PIN domain-containing protein [Myxococcales bacterium]